VLHALLLAAARGMNMVARRRAVLPSFHLPCFLPPLITPIGRIRRAFVLLALAGHAIFSGQGGDLPYDLLLKKCRSCPVRASRHPESRLSDRCSRVPGTSNFPRDSSFPPRPVSSGPVFVLVSRFGFPTAP
jgi:hypothetical protein